MADRKLIIEVSEVLPPVSNAPDRPGKEIKDNQSNRHHEKLFNDSTEDNRIIFI